MTVEHAVLQKGLTCGMWWGFLLVTQPALISPGALLGVQWGWCLSSDFIKAWEPLFSSDKIWVLPVYSGFSLETAFKLLTFKLPTSS